MLVQYTVSTYDLWLLSLSVCNHIIQHKAILASSLLSVIAINGKQREVASINSILNEREILESIVGILISWVGKV